MDSFLNIVHLNLSNYQSYQNSYGKKFIAIVDKWYNKYPPLICCCWGGGSYVGLPWRLQQLPRSSRNLFTGNFSSFFKKRICEVRHLCWMRRPGSHSSTLIHPKSVLSSLWNGPAHPSLPGPCLEKKEMKSKPFPPSWERGIVQKCLNGLEQQDFLSLELRDFWKSSPAP